MALVPLLPLGILDGNFDAGAFYDAVLRVSVGGVPRCTATVITPLINGSSFALSTGSCFLVSTALTAMQQADCLRGACSSDTLVSADSITLIGGPDSRTAPIVARVKRLSVRFAAWWAMPDVCSPALCGEGWDIALLELHQTCQMGPIPCVKPVRLPTAAPAFGLVTRAVGFGEFSGYDRRGEWDLQLGEDGSGVRRHVEARVAGVRSLQILDLADAASFDAAADAHALTRHADEESPGASLAHAHAELHAGTPGVSESSYPVGDPPMPLPPSPPPPPPPAEREEGGAAEAGTSPLCAGDLGAALLTVRDGAWELAGLGLYSDLAWAAAARPDDPALTGCDGAGGAWSVHASRCWLEAQAAAWGVAAPLSEAAAAECGGLDFFPPELAATTSAAPEGAHLSAVAAADGCAATDCGADGVCLDGRCVCEGSAQGPFCSVHGEAVHGSAARSAVVVSPSGADDVACGSTRAPCLSLRFALLRQYWDSSGRADAAAAVSVVLLQGTYAGENNTGLQLHGVPVVIRSLYGPDETLLDCTRGEAQWGALFVAGESPAVEVRGFSLRKCLTESQMNGALASHPDYAGHIAGAGRWPPGREGAVFTANRWLAS